jgi:hypothetical protein
MTDKVNRTSLRKVPNLLGQPQSTEKGIPTEKIGKRSSVLTTNKAANRQKWLTKWKQELKAIKNNQSEWQKELQDRKLLDRLFQQK